MASYGGLSVNKLKIDLSSRGARTCGRKEELIERLVAYDRNRNFSSSSTILPPSILPDWPTTGFKAVKPSHKVLLPVMTDGHINAYLSYRSATDKLCQGDLKSYEKGTLLLESGRVEACSLVTVSESIFFSGMVKAAMKKKVSYSCQLRINKNTAEIINSQCECPAGAGPHSTCKHISAILLAIRDFTGTGMMKIAKSCTEALQTFHVPTRMYKESPMQIESLKRKKEAPDFLSDPRPDKYKNCVGYSDKIRSLIINYCATSGQDITIRHTGLPADMCAATVDHDYLDLPFTEYWVDQSLKVTDQAIKKTEIETRKQSECNKWFEVREWRVTSSHFGTIVSATERRDMPKLCSLIVISMGNHNNAYNLKSMRPINTDEVSIWGFVGMANPMVPSKMVSMVTIWCLNHAYSSKNQELWVQKDKMKSSNKDLST